MQNIQSGILAGVPRLARYLIFSLKPGAQPNESLRALGDSINGETTVVGLGQSLIKALGRNVAGLRIFPAYSGPGFAVPSTPAALWIWLRGDDRGELLHRSRQIEHALADSFALEDVIDAFQYLGSRDLTGYEDGTENPQDSDAFNAAIVQGQGDGLNGSSFVAVQQWVSQPGSFSGYAEGRAG